MTTASETIASAQATLRHFATSGKLVDPLALGPILDLLRDAQVQLLAEPGPQTIEALDALGAALESYPLETPRSWIVIWDHTDKIAVLTSGPVEENHYRNVGIIHDAVGAIMTRTYV